ncbi:unnamed protein product [Cuscuta epithymum]|uniref:Uncharacterized protein n=1 Tax=Cuscuta epithymum TaxID=186058 RepID=A0AAV0F6N1_9ASTE|nr:unnamed protein product [Cuscuta epithymum]
MCAWAAQKTGDVLQQEFWWIFQSRQSDLTLITTQIESYVAPGTCAFNSLIVPHNCATICALVFWFSQAEICMSCTWNNSQNLSFFQLLSIISIYLGWCVHPMILCAQYDLPLADKTKDKQ